MTDKRAKEIAERLRAILDRSDSSTAIPSDQFASLVLHLYDEVQALKSGVAFLGIGGSIKRGGE